MFTNDYSLVEPGAKTPPAEKDKDKKERKCKEPGKQKNEITVDAAAGPKSSDSEQKEGAKGDLADQSEAHKQPADTVGESEPEAEKS